MSLRNALAAATLAVGLGACSTTPGLSPEARYQIDEVRKSSGPACVILDVRGGVLEPRGDITENSAGGCLQRIVNSFKGVSSPPVIMVAKGPKDEDIAVQIISNGPPTRVLVADPAPGQ